MNDLQAGIDLVKSLIQFKTKHPDYQHVCDLATEYRDIFTKAGVAMYLKRYRNKENDDQFNQMLDIYESIIPSIVDNLDTMFEKPLRSNRIYSTIEVGDKGKRDLLMDRIERFWKGTTDAGVDAFLRERWKHDVLFDPNAFIAIEFNDFDSRKEAATPFAIEYPCHQVYNFDFINGVLDWLLVEVAIKYKVRVSGNPDGAEKIDWADGSKFIMYLENDAAVFTEVHKDHRLTDIPNPVFIEIMDTDNKMVDRVFVLETFQTKASRVPAFRVGYKLDPETNKRTAISNAHYSLAFFKKELRSGAELDLTIRAHVFPQKYMYGPKCEGDPQNAKPCNRGKTPAGTNCEICGGTGTLPIHTSAGDVIVVPLPKKGDEPILNLQQAMAYFSPPMDLVTFMELYSDRLRTKAIAAVFPSDDLVQQTTYAKTATEMDYSMDSRYDAYRKFAAMYSYAWVFIHSQVAIYIDIKPDAIVLYHRFPSDFKFKSISVLLTEGKDADSGNFPQHVKEAIHNDIANLLYADDQDTLQKIQIKNKFIPFAGKSDAEKAALLSNPEVLQFYKVLYTYFDIIFQDIDNDPTLGDKFYILAYAKQKDLINKKVDDLVTLINKNKATTFLSAVRETEKQPAA